MATREELECVATTPGVIRERWLDRCVVSRYRVPLWVCQDPLQPLQAHDAASLLQRRHPQAVL